MMAVAALLIWTSSPSPKVDGVGDCTVDEAALGVVEVRLGLIKLLIPVL